MKKILLGLVCLGTFVLSAQEKTLLWKISGNGLQAPSYLFGTIHLSCDASLDPKTIAALDKTKQLYLELDMDDPSLQQSMMAGMSMKDKTMTSMASEADIKMLDAVLQDRIGIPVVAINTIKPAMVSTMILPMLMGCPVASVETTLTNATKEQKEEVFGLETVQEQLSLFDAIPYQDQMDELIKSARDNFKSDKEELENLTALYKAADLEGMLTLMNTSENKLSSKFQDQLLNSRNSAWIPKIEKAAKEKPTLFAVGAGHLPGDKGVIKLLQKKGYKVEPVLN